jgi:CheY-like chemotaxis protein
MLSTVLAGRPGLRARTFENIETLSKYVVITGIDLLVCDFSVEGETADHFIPELRATPGNENPMFRAIALVRQVPPQMRSLCAAAGIDEIIVKPMSPLYVQERVLARLDCAEAEVPARRKTDHESPEFQPELYGDNVVALFPRSPEPAS